MVNHPWPFDRDLTDVTVSPSIAEHSPWPHRWAVLLVCLTFPLIWIGGLVTTYQAGMAVPDWPNTFGYNLLLYPWQTWVAGPFDLFIEHGHRLLGALVGLVTLGLAWTARRTESRRWVQFLALAAVPAVIGQGVLGGLRVRMDQQQLALIHGCTAPVFFALAVALATVTSRGWHQTTPSTHADAGRTQRLAVSTTALAYLQIVVGANVRHVMAVGDRELFRVAVIFHLLLAVALAVHVPLVWQRAAALGSQGKHLSRPAFWLAVCFALQLLLGVATWVVNYGWPVWFRGYAWAERFVVGAESMTQSLLTTAHVANGSLILGVAVCLTLRTFHALSRQPAPLRHTLPMGVLA